MSVGPTGDIALADTTLLTEQRVLRRLLTNSWKLYLAADLWCRPRPVHRPARRTCGNSRRCPGPDAARGLRGKQPGARNRCRRRRRWDGDLDHTIRRCGERADQSSLISGVDRMQLSLQNFSTLVQNMAAAVQGAANSLLDLTVGSVLRAILEANASLALWLQWLIVQVLQVTRLATCTGADCDSFGADFGFVRLPAITAVGAVTFGRFTPNIAAFIPVSTNISTAANTQSFYGYRGH